MSWKFYENLASVQKSRKIQRGIECCHRYRIQLQALKSLKQSYCLTLQNFLQVFFQYSMDLMFCPIYYLPFNSSI